MRNFFVTGYKESAGVNDDAHEVADYDHKGAVEQHFEVNHADYDWVDEHEFWVWLDGETPLHFKATAQQSIVITARQCPSTQEVAKL